MAKAQECPKCGKFFNPKFSGKQYGGAVICTDCYVYEQIKFDTLNTKLRNMSTARNKGG